MNTTTNTESETELIFIPLVEIEIFTPEEEALMRPPEKPKPESKLLPAIIPGERFLQIRYPQRPVLVSSLLLQGTKMLLAGSSKAGKTWLLMSLAIALANGQPWLGFATQQSRVLYVNLEILDDIFQDRCRMVLDALKLDSLGTMSVLLLRGYETDIAVLAARIVSLIKEGDGFDVVIIDPVYKCYDWRDENSASDMADLLKYLECIVAATGASVVFSTHFSKGNQASKNILDRVSGSGVFARDADTFVSFTEHLEEDHYSVELVIRNGPAEPPFVVRREFPVFHRTDLDPTLLKRSNRRAKTTTPAPIGRPAKWTPAEILGLLDGAGTTFSNWEKAAKEKLGCSEGTFKARLNELKEAKQVTQREGKYFSAFAEQLNAVFDAGGQLA
jgi:hypothetical protein